MVTYRVENIEQLIAELESSGVKIVNPITTYEYGKFADILDLDGNKVGLWEPYDQVYDQYVEGRTK